MSATGSRGLRARRVLTPPTLIYFYRRRLRAHGTQELLAGVGVTVAVALILAAGVAQGSVSGSTRQILRAVIGPTNLQLRARGSDGMPESLLGNVEAIPQIKQAAPLLEASVRIGGRGGRSAQIYLAGTEVSLGVLDGLGKTLPLSAENQGTISLTTTSAKALGLDTNAHAGHGQVTVLADGQRHTLPVSTVLGSETVGVLATAKLAVMPLATMQTLLGEPGRISRVLVHTAAGKQRTVAARLSTLAKGRLDVAGAEQDIEQLRFALRPSAQASALFAVIGGLLGLLLAFNAILLTVPERRQAIADLRLSGTPRGGVAQLVIFQALCLGVAASAVGVGVGYVLARWVLHQSTGYLAEAFPIGGGTVVPLGTVLLAAGAGLVVTLLASSVPLLDLRAGAPRDSVYLARGVAGNALSATVQLRLAATAVALAAAAGILYAASPSLALAASGALALATVLAVPLAFTGVLAGARALSEHAPRLSTLAIALNGLRGATTRSIALAATGAVALFGGVALGGARSDLLHGIRSFAHAYSADAPIWVSEPGDNQATGRLAEDGQAGKLEQLPGVARVERFEGSFMTLGQRRVWVIARPPGAAGHVLDSQTVGGPAGAPAAGQRLGEGGWVVLSEQIASQLHAHVGGSVSLPTPTGEQRYRLAALSSNLAWPPGVVFISSDDYTRAWADSAPSALAIYPANGTSTRQAVAEIRHALGPGSGAEVASSASRQADIDRLTSEGLGQLGIISTLLVIAAVLALAAALASSINQRRGGLASLRLSGAPPARLRRIMLTEASLMLAAGCATGALLGVAGQFIIDAYLRHVTGFPVAAVAVGARPIEILAIVLAAALAAAAIPGWLASRVAPALALAEE